VECKNKVIPPKTEETRTIWKSISKYLSDIPGKHVVKELRKAAILGTAHRHREVLMWKYKST